MPEVCKHTFIAFRYIYIYFRSEIRMLINRISELNKIDAFGQKNMLFNN